MVCNEDDWAGDWPSILLTGFPVYRVSFEPFDEDVSRTVTTADSSHAEQLPRILGLHLHLQTDATFRED